MIKIFLTVRNRLAITKKCIHALKEHSRIKHSIYVYNNQTNYLLDEHFGYFYKLFEKGYISQVSFLSDESTFNAFSKASACNFFGLQHEQDPNKDKYNFIVMLDNDIIVTPGWDEYLHKAWSFVAQNKMKYIKVIGQLPGGIKNKKETITIDPKDNFIGRTGKLGGSGLWSVKSNFFSDVGFLNLKNLIGHDKKHDQLYWRMLEKSTNGHPYIMGINKKLGIHCGKQAGSVCNKLTRGPKKKDEKLELIKFPKAEEMISKVDFKAFYEAISNNKSLMNDW